MSFCRLLAVGKCVDGKPAGKGPFQSGGCEVLLDFDSAPPELAAAASESSLAAADVRRVVRGGKGGWPLRPLKAWRQKRVTSGKARWEQMALEGFQVKRNDLWESDWEVRVAASERLALGPRPFWLKRRLRFGAWWRGCLRFLGWKGK